MNTKSLAITALRILLQTALLFFMLFCVFAFAASYEYPGINRYHFIYTLLLLLSSYCFVKLADQAPHRIISFNLVVLTFLIWIFVFIRELVV